MSQQILISTLGFSPGVVTGAYFILEREGYGRMDKVVSITTASLHAAPCAEMIHATLAQANPQVAFEQRLAVNETELRDSAVTQRFTHFMRHLLEEAGRTYDQIHLNISGGRKSMVAAALIAVQQYLSARPQRSKQVHVYHLELLDETIEENGHIGKLAGMTRPQQRRYLNPPPGSMALVEVAVLPIVQEPAALWARLFEFTTGAYLLEQGRYTQVRFNYYPAAWKGKKGLGEIDVYAEQVRPPHDQPYEVDHYKLRTLLAQKFNLAELRTLAYDLEIDPDEMGTRSPSSYAGELIGYMERRDRLQALLDYCQRARQEADWAEAVRQLPILLAECKLRVKEPANKPITTAEVGKLANKMAAMRTERQRPVAGWLVSNAAAAEAAALALAQAHQISLQQAHLPGDWQEKADWQITKLTPIL